MNLDDNIHFGLNDNYNKKSPNISPFLSCNKFFANPNNIDDDNIPISLTDDNINLNFNFKDKARYSCNYMSIDTNCNLTKKCNSDLNLPNVNKSAISLSNIDNKEIFSFYNENAVDNFMNNNSNNNNYYENNLNNYYNSFENINCKVEIPNSKIFKSNVNTNDDINCIINREKKEEITNIQILNKLTINDNTSKELTSNKSDSFKNIAATNCYKNNKKKNDYKILTGLYNNTNKIKIEDEILDNSTRHQSFNNNLANNFNYNKVKNMIGINPINNSDNKNNNIYLSKTKSFYFNNNNITNHPNNYFNNKIKSQSYNNYNELYDITQSCVNAKEEEKDLFKFNDVSPIPITSELDIDNIFNSNNIGISHPETNKLNVLNNNNNNNNNNYTSNEYNFSNYCINSNNIKKRDINSNDYYKNNNINVNINNINITNNYNNINNNSYNNNNNALEGNTFYSNNRTSSDINNMSSTQGNEASNISNNIDLGFSNKRRKNTSNSMLSMKRLGNPINAVLKAIKEENIEDIEQSKDKLISLALNGKINHNVINNNDDNNNTNTNNYSKIRNSLNLAKNNSTKDVLTISRSNTNTSLNKSYNFSSASNINIFNFNNFNSNNINNSNYLNNNKNNNTLSSEVSINDNSSPYNINNEDISIINQIKNPNNDSNYRASLFNRKKSSCISLKKVNSTLKKNCCSCKQSHCLKLYCECFKMEVYCIDCTCPQCFNRENFEVLRQQSINHLKNKSKHAFKSVVTKDEKNNIEKHIKGCKCKNSNCKKNYCECFQNGMSCSDICKCLNCSNGKPIDANNNNNNSNSNNNIQCGKKFNSSSKYDIVSEEEFNSEKYVENNSNKKDSDSCNYISNFDANNNLTNLLDINFELNENKDI